MVKRTIVKIDVPNDEAYFVCPYCKETIYASISETDTSMRNSFRLICVNRYDHIWTINNAENNTEHIGTNHIILIPESPLTKVAERYNK